MILELLATGALSLALGILIGANNPVRVKLASARIEDLAKEALDKAVDEAVDELKKLRMKKG